MPALWNLGAGRSDGLRAGRPCAGPGARQGAAAADDPARAGGGTRDPRSRPDRGGVRRLPVRERPEGLAGIVRPAGACPASARQPVRRRPRPFRDPVGRVQGAARPSRNAQSRGHRPRRLRPARTRGGGRAVDGQAVGRVPDRRRHGCLPAVRGVGAAQVGDGHQAGRLRDQRAGGRLPAAGQAAVRAPGWAEGLRGRVGGGEPARGGGRRAGPHHRGPRHGPQRGDVGGVRRTGGAPGAPESSSHVLGRGFHSVELRAQTGPVDTYTHGHAEPVLQSHRWRTAENSAAYLLPALRPGMDLLDVGCGPGTITVDLAARVAPGRVVGLDVVGGPAGRGAGRRGASRGGRDVRGRRRLRARRRPTPPSTSSTPTRCCST